MLDPRLAGGLLVAVLAVCLPGCRLFGIDTRPGIEYVTINHRRLPKEPMYTRPIAGTNLVKRWPQRLGVEYGYAPWEEPPENPMVGSTHPVASAMPAETSTHAPGDRPELPARGPSTTPPREVAKQIEQTSPRPEPQSSQSSQRPPAEEDSAPPGSRQSLAGDNPAAGYRDERPFPARFDPQRTLGDERDWLRETPAGFDLPAGVHGDRPHRLSDLDLDDDDGY